MQRLNFWGKGIYKTASGHLRYSSPKELRGELVHRKVVKDLIEEMPFSLKNLLPWPYEVHHLDFNKTHNCPYNLLVLSESFHSALTSSQLRIYGRFNGFHPRWKSAPEWKLFEEDQVGEVPF